jgi:cysteinyl-tRNA synthetase
MPEFRLYNTLTRAVESFVPADGQTVRMYTCGPTVYDPAHVGNFRTFLFNDLLRRALRLQGWKVVQVQNLTDVDDKIIKRANATGKSILEVTEPVTETFHKDRRYLRIEDAEEYPKATTHIPEMIALVARSSEKKVAYRPRMAQSISASIGLRITELSRLDTREIRSGASRRAGRLHEGERPWTSRSGRRRSLEDESTGAAWMRLDVDAPDGTSSARRWR